MSGDRIYVLASKEQAQKFMTKGLNWVNADNQNKFKDSQDVKFLAVSAVAEYLANQKGFTMYECNATYPKDKN